MPRRHPSPVMIVFVVVAAAAVSFAADTGASPEGLDPPLAAKYPGDVGLGGDPAVTAAGPDQPEDSLLVPVLDGKWWQIAPNAPDVGGLSTGEENACDFALFQVRDGSWCCISCIRGTKAPGQRIFYQWRADRITDENWKPIGFLDVERGQVGKPPQPTSVQAPHPLVWNDRWYLFYNSAGARCLIGEDGINWKQHRNVEGQTKFFDMGRDVAVFWDEPSKRWIAYYCGNVKEPEGTRGAMVARTASALEGPWSKEARRKAAGADS